MAVFIASTQSISRSRGQSAVASVCYRAGIKAYDKRYGKMHDYSKRSGVISVDIVLPVSLQGYSIDIDREKLWNLAESSESRKNSRVAREWLVNLPYELSEKTRRKLAFEFAQALSNRFGVIADVAIHKPTKREIAKGADPRNHHAHIMLTTRQVEIGKGGDLVFGSKADCELSDTDRKKLGLCRAKDEVTELRRTWEQLVNAKLVENDLHHKQVDCRSYKDQGLDVIPQIKVGAKSTQLERRGMATLEGDTNRLIAERNAAVQRQQKLPQIIAARRYKRKQQHRKQDIEARYQSAKEARYERERQCKAIEAQRTAQLATINDCLTAAADHGKRAQSALTSANQASERAAQRIDKAKQAIERSKQQLDSSKRAADSSADTTHTRHRARQRLDQQANRRKQRQRGINNAITSVNHQTAGRKHVVDEFEQYIERYVRILAERIRMRHGRNFKLGTFESIEHHPNKFDSRQLSEINQFVKSTGLEFNYETTESIKEHITLCLKTFDAKFIENHHQVLKMITDPAAERVEHNTITQELDDFIAQNQLQQDLERQNVGILRKSFSYAADNIELFVTSTAYLHRLDVFINSKDTHPINRDLAQSYKKEFIKQTCDRYHNACNSLVNINLSAEYHRSQSEAVIKAKNEFLAMYLQDLDDNQITEIDKNTRRLTVGSSRVPQLRPKFR